MIFSKNSQNELELVFYLSVFIIISSISIIILSNFLNLNNNLFNKITIFFSILTLITTFVLAKTIQNKVFYPLKSLKKLTKDLSINKKVKKIPLQLKDSPLSDISNFLFEKHSQAKFIKESHEQIDKSKTRFLSITSHELRSPMTPMKAQLQMLEKGYFGTLNNKQKNAVKVVIRNANHLDEIIKDLLEVSRIEAARLKFRFSKSNINAEIKKAVSLFKRNSKNITIETKVEQLPDFDLDPVRFAQVLKNFLSNAIKFSKNNSKITITAKKISNFIEVSVKDQGIGIKKEDQVAIFEPFFQAEQTIYRERGGTGLGLSICKGIIKMQGGDITLNSEPNKGSTFTFTIPLIPPKDPLPILLLISEKEQKQDQIKEIFKDFLGPIGESEFISLLQKHNLGSEEIKIYLSKLVSIGVLTKMQSNSMLKQINKFN